MLPMMTAMMGGENRSARGGSSPWEIHMSNGDGAIGGKAKHGDDKVIVEDHLHFSRTRLLLRCFDAVHR